VGPKRTAAHQPQRGGKFVTRRTIVGICAVAAVLVALGSVGRSQLRARFEGRRPALDVMNQRPSDLKLTYEGFETRNAEGIRIAGWWVPASAPTGTILMVHGFGQNKSAMLGRAATLLAEGFNIALIDLRARGESGGDRTDMGAGAATDVLAAVDVLRNSGLHQTDLPLVAYGFSHGARTVLFAAMESPGQFAAIISEAPPYSLRDGLRRQTGLPWVPEVPEGDLPGAFLALRNHPILLLYGDSDPEISDAQAIALLASNVHSATTRHVFARTGHGVFGEGTRDEYSSVVTTFLARTLSHLRGK